MLLSVTFGDCGLKILNIVVVQSDEIRVNNDHTSTFGDFCEKLVDFKEVKFVVKFQW